MNQKILLIDDEHEIGIMLADAARHAHVDHVFSGEEAKAYLQEHSPDIIFLDVQLPQMSGMELLKQIRGQGLRSVVIMITAFATVETAVEAMKMGADDFLCKPVSIADLQQKVAQYAGDVTQTTEKPTSLEEVERQHIAAILQRNKGNRRETAEDLEISLRTLYYKIKQYDLE